jgi:hypothetical protein
MMPVNRGKVDIAVECVDVRKWTQHRHHLAVPGAKKTVSEFIATGFRCVDL